MDSCFVSSLSVLPSANRSGAVCDRKGTIQMAHHVQKKGAKKHNRYRPKKHCLSDINRKKPEYNVNPLSEEGLPPVFEIVEKASG